MWYICFGTTCGFITANNTCYNPCRTYNPCCFGVQTNATTTNNGCGCGTWQTTNSGCGRCGTWQTGRNNGCGCGCRTCGNSTVVTDGDAYYARQYGLYQTNGCQTARICGCGCTND